MSAVASNRMISASLPGVSDPAFEFDLKTLGAADRREARRVPDRHELWIVLARKSKLVREHALQGQHPTHLSEHVRGHRALDVRGQRRAHAQVEHFLDRRRPVAHVHFDRGGDRNMRAGVGGGFPADIAHSGHVYENAVLAEFAGFGEFVESRLHSERGDDMERDREAKLAPNFPRALIAWQIDLAAHEHREQLVGRRKMLLANARGVARIFRLVAPALEVAEHRAPPGRSQPLDRGVGMLRRMVDLAHVHHRRYARVDLRHAREQFVDVDVLRAIAHRELLKNKLVIIVRAFRPAVVDENAVCEKAAQRRLELVVVGVDEARHDDMPGRVDDGRIGRVDRAATSTIFDPSRARRRRRDCRRARPSTTSSRP